LLRIAPPTSPRIAPPLQTRPISVLVDRRVCRRTFRL
jgi:hypothetical protein